MTAAEAREHLKDILDDVPNDKCIDWIEALKKAIKVLEQIDKIKRLFKTKMRTMTRDEFNEDFEDSTISDIKDEMWELYIFLHKIEEVLEYKAESEVNADERDSN
jgi:hypothetical protein